MGMSNILNKSVACQDFETDGSELLNITQTPEEWSAFSILTNKFGEFDNRFSSFSLSLIPRSVNLKNNCLAF